MLPLIQFAAKTLESDFRQPLRGYRCLAVQHITESTPDLLEALSMAGIPPSDIVVVAKAYSCNHSVVSRLRDNGYKIEIAKSESRHSCYENTLARTIGRIIGDSLGRSAKLLV